LCNQAEAIFQNDNNTPTNQQTKQEFDKKDLPF
jgi:predicted small lipoprotein YifL